MIPVCFEGLYLICIRTENRDMKNRALSIPTD
jgi:hypothetical protein